jgi:hypothetical protein
MNQADYITKWLRSFAEEEAKSHGLTDHLETSDHNASVAADIIERQQHQLAAKGEPIKCKHCFIASYGWAGAYGAYEERVYVIVANTQTEALSMALEQVPNSRVGHWEVELIETTAPHVKLLSAISN